MRCDDRRGVGVLDDVKMYEWKVGMQAVGLFTVIFSAVFLSEIESADMAVFECCMSLKRQRG